MEVELNLSQEVGKQLRQVYFGGNWTSVNIKDVLSDVSLKIALKTFNSPHSIATLNYHMNYYVEAVLRVLNGGELDAKDSLSFDCPLIESTEKWNAWTEKSLNNAKLLARAVENLPEEVWQTNFKTYGTYYRNVNGIIQHTHYHLGQIVMLKKRATS
jgi:hypothetical protein